MTEDNLVSQFMKIGLSEPKAKETIKNGVLCQRLKTILQLSNDVKTDSLEQGTLYYHLASKMKTQHEKHLKFLVDYINSGKLNTTQRINAALEFLLSHVGENVDYNSFDKYCGVGVVVTPDEIEQVVENIIAVHKEKLLKERYSFNIGSILHEVRNTLKWADGKAVKNEVDLQVLTLLGPKLESELTVNKKPKKVAIKKTDVVVENNGNESDKCSIIDVMKRLNFHKPGENHKTDGYVITNNTERLLKDHLKQTNSQVRTRFPPEPNGILHIGHAKAININFGYAAAHNGVCILRYDDTNPEKEEKRFFDGIKDIVEWLGYKPHKITYSSDYFDQLYQLARKLINLGLAYVCHQNQSEMQGFNPPASPWRDRKPEENLKLFEDMKNGLIDEGGATLRMKVTLEEGKQDPVAYRIKFLPHPRSGNKWCIYPTYDYTHCLCDSIENITHSLCTKEFQSRRSAYYWLCNSLNLYCPVQWEYGRLNMNYTVVSKRKIATLISEKILNDWDDPRLFTLSALRRKGYPPEAINRFCAKMGVTGALCSVDPEMLEAEVRSILNDTAPRTMVVVHPIKVTILNFLSLDLPSNIIVDEFPDNPSRGNHSVNFSETIYIESSDFCKNPDKGYRRLTKNQPVGLRYAGIVIELSLVKFNKSGEVEELLVVAKKVSDKKKPKAFIHWVSNPITIQVNVYAPLFKHKEPENEPDGFLSDINTNSLSVFKSFADKYISKAKVRDVFQFERVGFYCVDDGSSDGLLVFNQTVSLKGDLGKS